MRTAFVAGSMFLCCWLSIAACGLRLRRGEVGLHSAVWEEVGVCASERALHSICGGLHIRRQSGGLEGSVLSIRGRRLVYGGPAAESTSWSSLRAFSALGLPPTRSERHGAHLFRFRSGGRSFSGEVCPFPKRIPKNIPAAGIIDVGPTTPQSYS